MNITNKFLEIINIQNSNKNDFISKLNNPISISEIQRIEELLEEKLPKEIIDIYSFANGQKENENGVFFNEEFCSSSKIIEQLEFSKTLINKGTNTITEPEKSEKLIKKIVDFYFNKVPKRTFLGIKKDWYKIEFQCGLGSFGGPYIYKNVNTSENERVILKIDFEEQEKISPIITELHELEKENYKWDKLKFIVYSEGNYSLERSYYDFDKEIPFTSTPKNTIKKKYFHYKWLPIFSDYGGNYIGIDLDPDINGHKGQVINFGRDEEDMYVYANSLDSFFDKILNEIQKVDNSLLKLDFHLHEVLKEITENNCP